MLKPYIIFIFTNIEDKEDIDYLCTEHFSQISENGIKYVIESSGKCVIIFESPKDKKELKEEIEDLLSIDNVIFYFLFEKKDLISSKIQQNISNLIFKPNQKPENDNFTKQTFNLDQLLEKISTLGVKSLSEDEKKFLDKFGN